MRGIFTKRILVSFVVIIFAVTGMAVAEGSFNPSNVNTVTQTHNWTTTITSSSSTYTSTETATPYETLSTTTVWGTGSYTVTVTKTTSCSHTGDSGDNNDGCQKSVTTTTETTADYYMPLAMYFTATTNNPFYRQLKPIVLLPPKPHDSSYIETIGSGNSVTLTIVSNSTAHRDLGFYYEFQNLASLNAFLASGGSHTVTIIGTHFAVDLWVNPGALKWGPGPVPPMEVITSSSGFASGSSSATGTQTVSSSTPIHMATAAGSCSAGVTKTISQLTTACGIPTSTPFALWIGISSTSVGTTSATVNSMYSSPYP